MPLHIDSVSKEIFFFASVPLPWLVGLKLSFLKKIISKIIYVLRYVTEIEVFAKKNIALSLKFILLRQMSTVNMNSANHLKVKRSTPTHIRLCLK